MKISFCLPTFNRSEFIIEKLRFLSEEIKGYEDIVEIIVSDNCSEFSVIKDIELYHQNNNFFQLYLQNENLGLIGNVVFLLNRASGEYVWFIGDDDLLEKGILNVLLKIVAKHPEVAYVFFNHDCFKNNLNNIVKKFDLLEFSGYHNSFSKKMFNLLDKHGTINMFMTSNVYRRSLLLEHYLKFDRPSKIDDFLVFCFICSHNGASFVVPEILVHDNYTKSTWSKSSRRIFSTSVPNRIIDLEKVVPFTKEIKNSLYIFYYKGRGNFIHMLLNASAIERKRLINYLGIISTLFLLFRSFYLNILRFNFKKINFGN